MAKISRMKGPRKAEHRNPKPHLRAQRMSARGRSAFAKSPIEGDSGGAPMAFPSTPGTGPAFGPPDMSGGGAAPDMGSGAPPAVEPAGPGL